MFSIIKSFQQNGLLTSAVVFFAMISTTASLADFTAADPIPAEIGIGRSATTGPIYTTTDGWTLYTTVLDETPSGAPGCLDTMDETGTHHLGQQYKLSEAQINLQKTCVEKWPPFRPRENAKAVGKWTIKSRPDGSQQWAYTDQFVYLSARDKKAFDVHGVGAGFRTSWRLVPVPLHFPPGIKLAPTLEGLVLATKDDTQIIFAATADVPPPIIADWIPLAAASLAQSNGDWAVTQLGTGIKQWSFKNKSLYIPGRNMTHQRIRELDGLWLPVNFQKNDRAPSPFTMHYTLAGWVFADAQGRSIYVFSCSDETPDRLYCDEPGDPAIYRSSICGSGESCAEEWQPVLAGSDAVASVDWGINDVPDPPFSDPAGAYGVNVPTVRAWTFRGRPVYTFSHDKNPGDIEGNSIKYYGVSSFNLVKVLNVGPDGGRYYVDRNARVNEEEN